MDRQTRVEKYKKLRESIKEMDAINFNSPYQISEENPDKGDRGMSDEDLQNEYVKKNTLSMSIDQIVKAHDQYTTIVSAEEIEEKNKEYKKSERRKLWFRIVVVAGIVIAIGLIVALIILLATSR